MSMYGVNCSVPKTLVKHLVAYEAERRGGATERILRDILDTPISPELLPSDGKTITQITEDKVGPYDLHDFFLFCFSRYAFPPEKTMRLAEITFRGKYEKETIKKWLVVFLRSRRGENRFGFPFSESGLAHAVRRERSGMAFLGREERNRRKAGQMKTPPNC